MKDFKIRSSGIGTLMTGTIGLTDKQEQTLQKHIHRKNDITQKPLTPNMVKEMEELITKKESNDLPKTIETLLKTDVKQWLYQKRKSFGSKQTDKGNMMEDDAIDFIAKHLDIDFLAEKNEQHFSDEFFKGTPDVILEDEIIDIKCSWDCFSFPLWKEELEKDYWWQGQGYMRLTGKRKYRVAYCLMDMPEEMIYQEVNRRKWMISNSTRLDDDIYEEVKSEYTYSHLPIELRLKVYEFEYDEKAIEEVIERVKLARIYIDSILLKHGPIAKVLELYNSLIQSENVLKKVA